jgi:hypothetical protein
MSDSAQNRDALAQWAQKTISLYDRQSGSDRLANGPF